MRVSGALAAMGWADVQPPINSEVSLTIPHMNGAAKRPNFTGFYSKTFKAALRLLSGPELKVFVAIALHADSRGAAWPGVRLLAELTGYGSESIVEILRTLVSKGFITILRQNYIDPLTGKMTPDVYKVSADLVVSQDSFLLGDRNRHSSIPVSAPRGNSAQPDRLIEQYSEGTRLSEADSAKHNQSSLEGEVALPPAGMQIHPSGAASDSPKTVGEIIALYDQPQQRSSAKQYKTPPGSAAPPQLPPLSMVESMTVNAVHKQIPSLSTLKTAQLVKEYGVEMVTAAVSNLKKQNERRQSRGEEEIKRPAGWLIQNLRASRKEAMRTET